MLCSLCLLLAPPEVRAGTAADGALPAEAAEPAAQASPALQRQLAELLDDQPGIYGVVVDVVQTGEQVTIGATRPFRAASVYKVLVAYAVLREVEAGRLTLDMPLRITDTDDREVEPAAGLAVDETVSVQQAVSAMLEDSSNLAAHRLMRLVGRANLNHLMADLGLSTTRVPLLDDTSPWPEDGQAPDAAMTTPAEMAGFLHRLVAGNLLREPARAALAGWLRYPEPLDPVAASLPANAEVYTKLGELDDAANVAGWVQTRRGPVVLAVFSEGTDPGSARETIGQLAELVYATFNP